MNTKVKAIIINVKDYKELDKLATLFSLEKGVINVKFTSVKKANAKLKSICQPFVFAEFELNEKNGFFTVVQAEIIDANFSLLSDYNKSVMAFCVFEIIDKLIPKNLVDSETFALILNTLYSFKNDDAYVVFINFVTKFFIMQGESLNLNLNQNIYFDNEINNFSGNYSTNSTKIDKKVYAALKNPYEQQNERILKAACRLLGLVVKANYDIEIKSLSLI